MPKEFPRARRVAEQVQRVLGEMLRREVRDPRLKPVTVTHVKVSPDLSHAWIYYELLNGDSHDPLQREILDDAAVYLRGPVGRGKARATVDGELAVRGTLTFAVEQGEG